MALNKATQSLMEHLFIVRHGSCTASKCLNSYGTQQMEEMGSLMGRIIPSDNRPLILSSSATRARESADILASKLGAGKIETFDYLWSASDSPWRMPYGDMNAVHFLVAQRRYLSKALVVVTHLEVSKEYPEYFTKQEFGRTVRFDELLYGETYSLDMHAREWKRLPAGVLVGSV